MKSAAFSQLFNSFEKLERSISAARRVVAERGEDQSSALAARLQEYEGILAKQRSFAEQMCNHAMRKNWYEVSRHMQIINSLSRMIRDDAREVITGVQPTARTPENEITIQ